MEDYSTYVGLDVHAETISVCALGADGKELLNATLANTPAALARLIAKLARRGPARFCYEAGPCGYGVHRQILAAGQACVVSAPSLIPRKPGERIKTDRRDARKLAGLLRAGELAGIWVPDANHEAMRDLVRARHQAMRARAGALQRLTAFLLRQGLRWRERRWTRAHRQWLKGLSFAETAHQVVFDHLIAEIATAAATRDRLEAEMLALLPRWPLAPLVEALRALRGIETITAMTLAAAIGDPRRFACAPALMAFFGLVPSEHTSGKRRRQGAITKTGDREVRRLLIEAAWCHRTRPRPSAAKQAILNRQPAAIRAIAATCAQRLNHRFRTLSSQRKWAQVTATAVARELTGFVWAVSREVRLPA